MEYRARTLTGRLDIYFGVSKSTVREVFLVSAVAVAMIAGFLFTVR